MLYNEGTIDLDLVPPLKLPDYAPLVYLIKQSKLWNIQVQLHIDYGIENLKREKSFYPNLSSFTLPYFFTCILKPNI